MQAESPAARLGPRGLEPLAGGGIGQHRETPEHTHRPPTFSGESFRPLGGEPMGACGSKPPARTAQQPSQPTPPKPAPKAAPAKKPEPAGRPAKAAPASENGAAGMSAGLSDDDDASESAEDGGLTGDDSDSDADSDETASQSDASEDVPSPKKVAKPKKTGTESDLESGAETEDMSGDDDSVADDKSSGSEASSRMSEVDQLLMKQEDDNDDRDELLTKLADIDLTDPIAIANLIAQAQAQTTPKKKKAAKKKAEPAKRSTEVAVPPASASSPCTSGTTPTHSRSSRRSCLSGQPSAGSPTKENSGGAAPPVSILKKAPVSTTAPSMPSVVEATASSSTSDNASSGASALSVAEVAKSEVAKPETEPQSPPKTEPESIGALVKPAMLDSSVSTPPDLDCPVSVSPPAPACSCARSAAVRGATVPRSCARLLQRLCRALVRAGHRDPVHNLRRAQRGGRRADGPRNPAAAAAARARARASPSRPAVYDRRLGRDGWVLLCRRRGCHSAATPSPSCGCFNRDGEGGAANLQPRRRLGSTHSRGRASRR